MTTPRAQKILQRLDLLAELSDRQDCLCREFGTLASAQGRDLVRQWMKEAKLKVSVDNMLNIRGVLDLGKPKTFLMGSHLDTVLNAGKFDGTLGVLLAVDQAERLEKQDLMLPYNLEVVGFSEEEGVRFMKPYLGSMTLAGTFRPEYLQLRDKEGITLEQVVKENGQTPQAVMQDGFSRAQLAGYLEVHIEQGPVLDQLQLPVGLVTDIVGQQRHQISFVGLAGHAGTVPIKQRKDALLGAAELVTYVEKLALEYRDMVATVGTLEVLPGRINVIPERVNMSLDIRHAHKDEMQQAVNKLREKTSSIAKKRQLLSYWEALSEVDSVQCNTQLNAVLRESIMESGYPVKHLVSGAGHDAVVLSGITPVCMLFVRCKEGISHHPLEQASLEDIESAIKVCDNFFDKLAAI
ncbi:MAG: M20 family metallo-hydrolase [Cyclobacteriaceae bacterium]|nr:M20 family metallo-hydrolase [Cyclobacteriaceae bacterium]